MANITAMGPMYALERGRSLNAVHDDPVYSTGKKGTAGEESNLPREDESGGQGSGGRAGRGGG